MDWNLFRAVPKPLQPTRPCLEALEDRIVPSAPVLTLPGSQSKSEGQSVSIIVSATNPNNLTLSYSASTLPAGLSINTSTGLISGLVAYNNTSQGLTAALVASVSVTDGTAGDDLRLPAAAASVRVGGLRLHGETAGRNAGVADVSQRAGVDLVNGHAGGGPKPELALPFFRGGGSGRAVRGRTRAIPAGAAAAGGAALGGRVGRALVLHRRLGAGRPRSSCRWPARSWPGRWGR